MKKQILTLAAIAAVAIGAAVTKATAETFYFEDGSSINCQDQGTSCALQIGNRLVWDNPEDAEEADPGNSTNVYEDLQYVP